MAKSKTDLIERERFLEDVVATLKQERSFALSTKDWPRKRLVEERLQSASDRLLNVSQKLAVMGE